MNQYANEDMAWLRIQDLQREAENRRLAAKGRPPALIREMRSRLARAARRRTAGA